MCLYVLSSDIRYDFRIKTMFGSSLPPVVCMRAHLFFYVICVCLRIAVSNILCCVFSWYCVPYICMLPVSLDCPFRILKDLYSTTKQILGILKRVYMIIDLWKLVISMASIFPPPTHIKILSIFFTIIFD